LLDAAARDTRRQSHNIDQGLGASAPTRLRQTMRDAHSSSISSETLSRNASEATWTLNECALRSKS
jgi:hypothetical protein